MKKLLLYAFAVVAFVSCTNDDDPKDVIAAIELDHTELSLEAGQAQQLRVVLTPTDFQEAVVWSSSSEDIATVSSQGLVTAIAAGDAVVTVTCSGLTATCKLTITPLPVVSPFDVVSFEADEKMIDFKGKPATPRDAALVGGVAQGTYNNVLLGLDYADQQGPMGLTYDGLLFSTADSKVMFGSYYCDCVEFGSRMDTWCGLVLSKNTNTTAEKMDYKDQFSVWAASGANQTSTFAVAYDGTMFGGDYSTPIIELLEPRSLSHLYLANSTMVVTYLSSKTNYRYSVFIEGLLDGQITGSVLSTLIEEGVVTKDWIKVDLQKLGTVDKIKLTVMSNDVMAPTYFCIDEITLNK